MELGEISEPILTPVPQWLTAHPQSELYFLVGWY